LLPEARMRGSALNIPPYSVMVVLGTTIHEFA
jgi:hypothetical protein